MTYAQARTEILINSKGVENLQKKAVLVAGLGGVGGFCAEALVRAGVGTLIILDHDIVSISNLNRQLLALNSTIGREKTEIMAARIRDINPQCNVIVKQQFLRASQAHKLVSSYCLDYVADCIDSIACKAALVFSAQQENIPVISAMGAGNRLDVRKIKIKTLNQTSDCPLAREMRHELRTLGADLRYPVVFSDEPRRQPLPHQEITGVEAGRKRAVNGTISYMPAIFGMMMAGFIVEKFVLDFEQSRGG